MDKLNKYRRIISKIIEKQASYKASTGVIDEYAICDNKTDNYILFNVGWHNSGRRQFGYPIHIRIKDGKVLVEWDGTNQSIVEQLIDAGIDENDIVWNFDRPQKTLKAA
jgi:XisI protein